jgi:hypothetical protein
MHIEDNKDFIRAKINEINKLITSLYTARRCLNNCIDFLDSNVQGYPEYGIETAKEVFEDVNKIINTSSFV